MLPECLTNLARAVYRFRSSCQVDGDDTASEFMVTSLTMAEAIIGDHPDRRAMHAEFVRLAHEGPETS